MCDGGEIENKDKSNVPNPVKNINNENNIKNNIKNNQTIDHKSTFEDASLKKENSGMHSPIGEYGMNPTKLMSDTEDATE